MRSLAKPSIWIAAAALAVLPIAGCGSNVHDFEPGATTTSSGGGGGGTGGGSTSATGGLGGTGTGAAGVGGAGGADPCPYSKPNGVGGCEPVCGTNFSVGAKVTAISSTAGDSVFGVAENGNILYWTSEGGPCTFNRLKLAEKSGASYVITDLTNDPELAAANGYIGYFGVDGETLVFANTDKNALLMGKLIGTDVTPLEVGPFTSVNGKFSSYTVSSVTMSGDLLVVIVALSDGTHHESRRASTSAEFPVLTKLTGDIQDYWGVDSLSYDGLTAFVVKDFYTSIFSRTSSAAAFTNANVTPIAAWGVKVAGTCSTLVATTSPGGCNNQDISFLNKL